MEEEASGSMQRRATALAMLLVLWACASDAPKPAPALPVVYDKDVGNLVVKRMKDAAAGKPTPPIEPYYLAQPTGPFTKEEIFGLCAYIGLSVTTAISAREKNEAPNRVFLELFHASSDLKSVEGRDPQLAERVYEHHRSALDAAEALSPDEAKERKRGFPEGRQFVEFNRSNIKACYSTLGSWQ